MKVMLYELAQFRSVITAEKAYKTYEVLEADYGVNQFYLWNIINKPDYEPPAWVCAKLGIAKYEPAPVCSVHRVVHCYDCRSQTVKAKPKTREIIYKDLWAWPEKRLLWALENRE